MEANKSSRLMLINQGKWCQESWESTSKQAGIRAKELRRQGYEVIVYSMGTQITPHGKMRLTMVDIRPGTNFDTINID